MAGQYISHSVFFVPCDLTKYENMSQSCLRYMGKAGDGLVSLAQQKSESVVRIQAQTAPIESVEIYMIHEAHI